MLMKFIEVFFSFGYLKNSMGVNGNFKRIVMIFLLSVFFNKLNMWENNVRRIFIYINLLYKIVDIIGVVYCNFVSYYNIVIIVKLYVIIIVLKFWY